MAERSIQCPQCPFSFARLVDAGDFHAYACLVCGWTKATTDRRPGNRPPDVCALCDSPIDFRESSPDHHLYVGPGWIHGGGREYIPIHNSCGAINSYTEGSTMQVGLARRISERLVRAA